MFTVFLRVSIIYATVLIFLRLMGKRQLGEMQPYEVVITLIIADLATIPMSDTNVPLLNGILPLAILVLIHFFITLLTRKSIKMRRLLSGKPVIVISPNGLEYSALKELNMNMDDLLEMMRQMNYYSFDQVLYAIIETNGKMSIIPNAQNSPLTASDMGIEKAEPVLPKVVISDGKIVHDQMLLAKLTEKKLKDILEVLKIKNIKDLLILTIDENGKIYYQTKNNKCKVVNINEKVSV